MAQLLCWTFSAPCRGRGACCSAPSRSHTAGVSRLPRVDKPAEAPLRWPGDHVPRIRAARRARALREQIRRFIRDEIIPLEQRIDPDAPEIPEEDYRRLSAKTKAAGLWCLGAPEEYGGGGLDTFSMCVVLEEMSQHRMGLYNPGCGVFGRYPPPVIWAGSKEQIEKYAVPDASATGCRRSSPSPSRRGGSDPAGAIQTRAEQRGDRGC